MNIIELNAKKINGVFETFDRMIINGYILQLCNQRQFLYYLIQNNVQLKDFGNFANEQTNVLCSHIENYIKSNGVELKYLNSGKLDKNELARQELSNDPSKIGLIAAFSAVELCNTMTVKPNKSTQKLEIVRRPTKCKHYYFYYNDEEFGWMFIKIQTWFPYNVQIYINGREYMSQVLSKNNIPYEMYNNSFSYIEDFSKAQELADSLLNKKMSDSFDGLIKKINCLLPAIKDVLNHSYYWCIDQCEFATDINFKNREDLSAFYKTLVETSFFTFSSNDIYSFFGRNVDKIYSFKKGEIVSDLRRRYQGYRIKFKINNNQVKMYDKGNNLRIEVTINNPKDFKILKTKETVEGGKLVEKKAWLPMGKSVANLYRYIEISKSITKRYIDALPIVDLDKTPVKDIEGVSAFKATDGKRHSGFNLLSKETTCLIRALASGDFIINGFNNKSIRTRVFENSNCPKIINKTTRIFSKLKAHGFIKKVPRKNRYYLTVRGRSIANSVLLFVNKDLLNSG
ncbi:MAG: hypothetical protein LBH62_09680 [Nitrososphaerota archaeon]|nr:hypothetical protein [Nitrososphaerota archaeon]